METFISAASIILVIFRNISWAQLRFHISATVIMVARRVLVVCWGMKNEIVEMTILDDVC